MRPRDFYDAPAGYERIGGERGPRPRDAEIKQHREADRLARRIRRAKNKAKARAGLVRP